MSTAQPAVHTPTPWRTSKSGMYVESPSGYIAQCFSTWATYPEPAILAQDNAAFIVRAVNSHAALVSALESLLRNAVDKARYISVLDGTDVKSCDMQDHELDSPEMAQARAAIALAKEGGK